MKDKINFIFDTETNGFANCSVLSVSYIICKNDKILDKDTRYYFAKEPYNYHAFKVHGLDENNIENKRDNCNYSLHFTDDKKWLLGVFDKYNVNNIVAHNISFDMKFLSPEIKKYIDKSCTTFCTMQQNRHLTPNNKAPKLIEACELLNIEFDENKAHNSDYDTLKCFEVFIKSMG